MANSKLIVVEGPQGAGKTTITDFFRYSLSYTNLYRLCGTSDSSPTGRQKSKEMYENLLEYIKKMENKNINLVFDRTFFTEEVFCRLGFKEYSFTDIFEKLLEKLAKMDFDIYYITLYLSNESLYKTRLDRSGKALYNTSSFDAENSIAQQREYLKMADEIKEKYPNINVINIANDRDLKLVEQDLRQIIGF